MVRSKPSLVGATRNEVRTYLRVRWLHDEPDEPVVIYSELDGRSRELRKVEVFADGSTGSAGVDAEAVGPTRLAIEPIPPLEGITEDPQFRAEEIEGDEFEAVWEAARHRADA